MTLPSSIDSLPRYDWSQTYQWNYDHAPDPPQVEIPPVPGDWTFCGLPVYSPLGMPAGPLLNGRWCLYYAALGFDVLTYKTVRSRRRACYDLPNLQPVRCGALQGGESDLPAVQQMDGSWAVSFGMPSAEPDIWRADVEATRRSLSKGKLLSVSVVASQQEGWKLDDLADDYARCARWAVESGADCVETNFSCPNVTTCDGQLYQQAADAGQVAACVRQQIGKTPYIVKIGHIPRRDDAIALLESLAPHVDALAMTNSIAATVADASGKLLFDGQQRGICGEASREASLTQVAMMTALIQERRLNVKLTGVGGVSTAEHVRRYLESGAQAVHIATAAMIDPAVGIAIRRELANLVS